ncbi:MAG: adenylyl cyclase-associated [Lasallia pustulata]|uniref:Adenylyl cyclase-associated protein n=1 Tax=Lasallia pustulata TaxID=136370 RepID=A0A5M8PCQ0_9LECA|nr:MAG: adenylyl cyclase-associated [Lasallia pustulata]
MHDLTALIKRLEAAASRFEDMAQSLPDQSSQINGIPSVPRTVPTEDGTDQLGGTNLTPLHLFEPLPLAVEDFDKLINGDVKTYANMSEELGGLVAEQSSAVLRAFAAERKFLIITTRSKKPDIQSPIYMEILKELQSMMGSVRDLPEANRGSPLINHLTTVSEGIGILGWITIEPKPADYVTDIFSSAQYYGNRVLREYKDKDHAHVEWAQAFYRISKSLTAYVRQHYPKGIIWNNDGIEPEEALRQVQSGQTSSKAPSIHNANSPSAPPPPPPPLPSFDGPPPPPPMPTTNGMSTSRSGTSDMSGVFEQLSKGESVTAGLRKVDPSSQTHKNPSLRAGATVPTRSDSQNSAASPSGRGKSPVPGPKPNPGNMRTKKPPRKELDGNKWIIENYDSPAEGLIEIEATISQSILISRCTKTAIRVINKANAISLDNCAGVSLIVDSLVSAVDVIKCPAFALQVLGTLPTIMLDQVDGATIYLGTGSLGTEVFTSKCAAVNVNLPGRREEDDYRECPLPEQLKSVVRNGVLVSEIVDHAG